VRGGRELSDPVLGRFLEYSLATPDIRASFEFYAKLGFSTAEVGEAWTHPYVVVTDGRINLGLHQYPAAPALTFVRADVLHHAETLETRGVAFEFRHLGNEVFNEVGWLDPAGHLIRLIEARTFSPGKRLATDTSLCGYFLEIALPTPDPESAKQYWERFGFVGMDEPDAPLPHVACTSDSIDIGLYDPAHLRVPTLVFDAGDLGGALARLAEAGILPSGQIPQPLRTRPAAMLTAPEGTAILLLPESEG
jgi:catechol 2,3-dioxygenase-like lactoylglutathione lyase family enzyme